MPFAVIRTDATQLIGGGHVMRCLSLANVLADNGWQVLFCGIDQTLQIAPLLGRASHEWRTMESVDNAEELRSHVPDGCDVLIVDHYSLDQKFERKCRDFARKILVIDDLANRSHDCNVLLDQTLGRSPKDYKHLVPADCRLLLGPSFALLRPQFTDVRKDVMKKRAAQNTLTKILVSFGTTDPYNLSERSLLALQMANFQGHTDVITGPQTPHIESIRAVAARSSFSVTVHSEVDDMAALMVQADLSIGAGGTTSWERCCVGLASLIIVVADNQKFITSQLEKVGAAACLGWHETTTVKDISDKITTVLRHPEHIKQMSEKAATVCDGLGSQRTYQALIA